MAEEKSSLKEIVARYRQVLESSGIRCEEILVYGSRADGTATEGSDIDLVVISTDWEDRPILERLEILGIAAARIMHPIQAVGFTRAEIDGTDLLPFWKEIINNASKAA